MLQGRERMSEGGGQWPLYVTVGPLYTHSKRSMQNPLKQHVGRLEGDGEKNVRTDRMDDIEAEVLTK